MSVPLPWVKVTLNLLAYFMLFKVIGKGKKRNMELKRPKEYQTIRLFAILGLLTLMIVLLFKVVLFAPQTYDMSRVPAQTSDLPNLQTIQSPPSNPNK